MFGNAQQTKTNLSSVLCQFVIYLERALMDSIKMLSVSFLVTEADSKRTQTERVRLSQRLFPFRAGQQYRSTEGVTRPLLVV